MSEKIIINDKACKALIRRMAEQFNIDPRLITTRLMSEDDKNDMRYNNLPYESLKMHIQVWIDKCMPDYVRKELEGTKCQSLLKVI
jgi:hypothetical protein